MKLKKCTNPKCEKNYTLEENCPECSKKTSDAHYKFVKAKYSLSNSNVVKRR